jgi:hypothetical protein
MVQEFTFSAVVETVVVPPLGTRVGEALIETVGTSTVIATMLELTEPPGPTQYIW